MSEIALEDQGKRGKSGVTKSGLPCRVEEADRFLSRPTPAVVSQVAKLEGDFLVLGAAGKMGFNLCQMLRQSLDETGQVGRKVIAVSRFREPSDRARFESEGLETICGDLSDRQALAKLPDAAQVIFMAGAKFGTADQPELLRKMNEVMPQQVADRFAGSTITAFSTGCVYPYCPVTGHGASETTPVGPVGAYAQSCLGREQAFASVAESRGTKVCLIRLNYAVEFRYGVLVDLAKQILAGKPIDLSMGHVNLIWQRDAVAFSLLAHGLASSPAKVLNVTGPEVLRVRDLASRLGEHLGVAPKLVGEEEPTAWLNDASEAIGRFGPPEVSVEQMLVWVAAWQRQGLPDLGKPTGFERRDGQF